MKTKSLLFSAFLCLSLPSFSQQLPNDGSYIDAGGDITEILNNWQLGQQITEDDNFYISRIKPKQRFRNLNTQVNQAINETNDKKLVFWVPINNERTNALPNGVFDSEVFPMWNYITHYGNWTTGFVRMPGNFADAAHKNGVGVSVTASVPWGGLTQYWRNNMLLMMEKGPSVMADLLTYYGMDGIGYNSEWSTDAAFSSNLINYHKELHSIMKQRGATHYDMVWYDGTNDTGGISFDRGLGTHNQKTFGDSENIATTSLFFNYNWNNSSLLQRSVDKAISMGRDPLDIYAGLNMQGSEPRSGQRWPLLKDYPISIGLWGAHSQNMFFETRGEKGSLPDVQQRAYMHRVERWFTGGSRNPINTPEFSNSMNYNADNYSFFGMSKMMSARSALSWDLSVEPFITNFNLGNGKFFNWNGTRQNNGEWYNIGIQDHLPTWRWWFATKFLGRDAVDAPAKGLDAEFVWDDAWLGGSLVRIFGTHADEYLHLFKTQFTLAANDVITVRYKVMGGSTDLNLALSAEGNEAAVIAENNLKVIETSSIQIGEWIEKKFTIRGGLSSLDKKTLAVVALHFRNAENLNLYLGEFSIVRGTSAAPATPQVVSTSVLTANYQGVDGKIIFNMPNDKPVTETCYNIDVKTSMFKLYAQQEGKEPILMTTTTSWAGMYFSVPFDFFADSRNIRFGVSAVSLDMKSESEIAWGNYTEVTQYVINDAIALNKNTIKPNEGFTVSYVDPLHEVGKFEILDNNGTVIKEVNDATFLTLEDGDAISQIGAYTLRLSGKVADENGNRVDKVRTYASYIQVTSTDLGALPRIESILANDLDANIEVSIGDPIALKYTGRPADGQGSQGLDLQEKGFGFKASDMEMQPNKSFTLAFWVKLNSLSADQPANFVNIRDKNEGWPKTDWGWVWNMVNPDGTIGTTFRGTDASNNKELRYAFENSKLEVGPWTHLAFVYEYNTSGQLHHRMYINGVKQTPSGWSRTPHSTTTPGDAPFQGDVYGMRGANMVALGGTAFGRTGVDGILDNFQYWHSALTDEEVLATMESFDVIPENLYGYWDFETAANEQNQFISTGVKPVAGQYYSYAAAEGGGEGQGDVLLEAISYKPGSPFVKGSSYQVTTLPYWSIEKGNITNVLGNDVAGTANVQFAKPGVYSATLTLQNGWGSDSKTFQYITVGEVGIEDLDLEASLSAYPNPFIDHVNVQFSNAGEYTIRIFNINGMLVAEKTQDIAAGEMMQINVNAEAGAYVAQISCNGKLVKAVKLLKK